MTTREILGVMSMLAATIGLAGGPVAAQAPAGPAGHWEGTIQVPGQELAISVDLATNADAKWEGAIAIPAQNVKALPLSDITVKENAVGFAMKGVPGDPQFAGTVSKDGKSIAGDFSQGGATLPFTLTWKGEARRQDRLKSTSITKDLEGSWEGALNVEGTVLRLILKLSNAESGATGTLVSVDQGGGEIAISSITQTASHLQLNVGAIGAAFEGDLKDGQITGTWSQGPASLPLVFTRTQK
jgi:molybdopterin-binding protein